jgi:hypothetical protein
MGVRFVQEIRKSDRETGIPVENREFTYRAHYSAAERKCFVMTEGGMTVPFVGGRVWLTQVWDVNAGVGATAFAEKAQPLSGKEHVRFYRGSESLPVNPDTAKWFDDLMVR